MKQILTVIVLFFTSIVAVGQAPQGIAYQAVAYDSSGSPVPNQAISVKFEIRNLTATGTVLYSESFNVTTNSQGLFSVNIGMGTVLSGTFASIPWGNGAKYISVLMDLAGGTSYTLVGTTQLMSVPYTLYAENVSSSNSIRTVNNILDLENIVGKQGDIIYIKGHTFPGDGGGGNFMWRTDTAFTDSGSSYSIANGGTIIKATASNTGRWVRQYDGHINVRYFGALGYSGHDTDKIKKAIDFASLNFRTVNPPMHGTTVYFPSGGYICNKIVLKSGVSLLGDYRSTVISASKPGEPNYSTEYLFSMEPGSVQISVSNFIIKGRSGENSDKGCFYLNAQFNTANQDYQGQPASQHGGLWYSTFKNIQVEEFRRHGIYLKGGGANGETYSLPNQFVIFENVRVTRKFDDSNCLLIQGNLGQATFMNCQFDGSKTSEDGKRNLNSNVQLTGSNLQAALASCVVSFINSTFQDSDLGIAINWSTNITIDNCWFESLGIAIQIDGTSINPCKSINILNNLFTNAAGFGSVATASENIGLGSCVNISNSQVNILNNYVTVSDPNQSKTDNDYFVIANNSTYGGVNMQGNSFNYSKLNVTSGIMAARSVIPLSSSINTINCHSNKVIYVSPSANKINVINSDLDSNETLHIRASGGQVNFALTVNNNPGNLLLANKPSLQLNDGDIAIFTKIDNAMGVYKSYYSLTSIVRSSTP